jgi:hypothetical protein
MKRTPKQRVLRKWRNAYAYQGPHGLWAIFGSRFGAPFRYLSNPQKTAAQAWNDAARSRA